MVFLNYLSEINAFWDWLDTNSMSPSAIALWFVLMQTANRAGWPRNFIIKRSTLESKMGCGKSAIYAARNLLRQKKRIDFKERKGSQSTVFRIIPFAAEKQTQILSTEEFVSENPTQTETQPKTQMQTLPYNIINKTKLNKTDTTTPTAARAGAEEITPSWLFSQYFGREPVPAEKQRCDMWLESWDAELVEHAFFRACDMGQGNLAYVSGILQDYRRQGITDMGGVAEDDMRHDARGKRR